MQEPWDKALYEVRNNWCQRALVSSTGRHCAVGAVGYACMGDEFDASLIKLGTMAIADITGITCHPVASRMVRKLAKVIGEQYGNLAVEPHLEIEIFNDSHTQEEVIAVMEKAAVDETI